MRTSYIEKKNKQTRNYLNVTIVLIFTFFALYNNYYNVSQLLTSFSTKELALDSRTVKVTSDDVDHQNLYPYAYLPNSTAENYTWAGNQFFPPQEQPMDGPTFTPSEILRVFKTENTLWCGDSTGRQEYYTIYPLLSSDVPNTVGELQKNINKGKRGDLHPFNCPARTLPNRTTSSSFKNLGQVAGTDQNCSVVAPNSIGNETNDNSNNTITNDNSNNTIADWSAFSLDNRTGKLDFMYTNCLPSVMTQLSTYRNVVENEYSVLILSVGIWEISRNWDCRQLRNVTLLENVVEVLDFLHAMSGPSLFVVWKTHGIDAKHGGRTSNQTKTGDAFVQEIKDWFSRNEPKYMDLADFRLAVDERAFDRDRISGDLRPHWGLDARLLSIDLLSRIVYRKQKRSIQE